MRVCERNAAIEGVSDRVTFQRGSAASLPFADEYFDAAVSNFVFHEVGGVKDKREVIREALRVLKKGGKFAFQDEFLIRKMYGDPDALTSHYQELGNSQSGVHSNQKLALYPTPVESTVHFRNYGDDTGREMREGPGEVRLAKLRRRAER